MCGIDKKKFRKKREQDMDLLCGPLLCVRTCRILSIPTRCLLIPLNICYIVTNSCRINKSGPSSGILCHKLCLKWAVCWHIHANIGLIIITTTRRKALCRLCQALNIKPALRFIMCQNWACLVSRELLWCQHTVAEDSINLQIKYKLLFCQSLAKSP